jgi:exodeoxyribonuclease VII large subunit
MNESFDRQIKTVTEINTEIGQLLDGSFRFVRIRGEISTIRKPYSGHTYFVLKDEKSQLNAVLFKNQQRWLSHPLDDGQQVVCDGRISVYEPRGQYQLIVDTIDFDGAGQLRLLFDQLKLKLRSEGLFDEDSKRSLPSPIEKIVLITSPSGAAVHDFLSVCRKRQADLLVQILPVRVQGHEAAGQICAALRKANELSPDVIVLCRGGGSIEDLWSFNEESVARAVYQSAIPVVTGIGHETDFTIADFCADLRCQTPTAAAQMVTVDPAVFRQQLSYITSRLHRSLTYQLSDYTSRLSHAANVLSSFDKAFSRPTFTVDNLFSRMCGAMALAIEKQSSRSAELESRLHRFSPGAAVRLYQSKLQFLSVKFSDRTAQFIDSKSITLNRCVDRLDTLSPLKTLARGYSIVSRKNDTEQAKEIITDIDQVENNEAIEIRLHRGELDCQVVRKRL